MRLAQGAVLPGLVIAWLAACGSHADLEGVGGSGGTTSTTTTTSSSSTTTTTPSGEEFVGLACTDDGDCGSGRCLQGTDAIGPFSSFWGEDNAGGPAGGYCTLPCDDDGDCPGDGPRCLGREPDGFCVLGCEFGSSELLFLDEQLPAEKCHGRDDVMCSPVAGGGSVCIPVCGSDDECPGERKCDARVGLCVDLPREGSPLGAPCQLDDQGTPQDEDECAGRCVEFVDELEQPSAHLCSSYCSLGGSLDQAHNCGGPDQGICLFVLSTADASGGLGDMGVCSNACQSHGECNWAEELFCFDFDTVEPLGTGYCAAATPCPMGSECGPDEICLPSGVGPVCVDEDPEHSSEPLFPLGSAAGGGAGGSAGSGGSGASAGSGGAGGS